MAAPALPQLAKPGFSFSPGPRSGVGPFGAVPGQIGAPPTTYSQVGAVMPALPQLTQTAGGVVGDELAGKLSAGTVNFLQDKAAQFGVQMGMPGVTPGGFGGNQFLRNLGMSSEALSQHGVQDYNALLPTLASTQLQPGLEYEVAQQNALNAAAPDPRAAAQEQLTQMSDLYNFENPAAGTMETRNIPYGAGGTPGIDTGGQPAWKRQLHLYA